MLLPLFRLAPVVGVALLFAGSVVRLQPPASTEDTFKSGLELWRTPDAKGRACASCHSPDGIELAAYAYDEATLRRRATPHLGADRAAKIGAYITALRAKLHLTELRDPMTDRPMQPGGAVLPGTTPEERDRSFALTIPKLLPALEGHRIATLTDARKALAEVLALDPSKMRIGIDLNRLSEDKFHGNEHASLAHWIPDEPPLTFTPELAQAEDLYLADPSDANFAKVAAFYADAWKMSAPAAQAISLEKARSLLLFQHLLRTGKRPAISQRYPDPRFAPGNPFWDIGDMARIYTNMPASGLALPSDIAANKSGGPSLSDQMRAIRLPWLWLGWTMDPALQRTSFDRRTRYADWFSELLITDGPYVMHDAVMLTKKLASEAYDKDAWASTSPQHLDLNFSWILRDENWKQFAPADAKHRELFDRFLANSFRMFALLQTDELRHSGKTYLREPVIQQLGAMKAAVNFIDPGTAKEDSALFDGALKLVASSSLVPH